MDYYTYIASREWALLKNQVKARAGGQCERCGSSVTKLQVHHKTYERLGHERLTDLLGLCKECHMFLSAKTDVDPLVLKRAAQEPIVTKFLEGLKADIAEERDPIRIDVEAFLDEAKTPSGGFTRKFLEAIGVPWPPPRGWKKAYMERATKSAQY